jgi:acylphosphatase
MKRQMKVFFSGTVQGVGFRYAALNVARGHAVTGWVRNRSDGRVEMVAEGTQEELESFIENVENTMKGYISGKEILWDVPTGEWQSFGIASTL